MNSTLFYSIAAGVALTAVCATLPVWSGWTSALLSVAASVLLFLYQRSRGRWLVLAVVCGTAIGLVLGSVSLWLQPPITSPALTQQLGTTVTLTGVVDSAPESTATGQRVYLKTDTVRVLIFADRYTSLAYGDTLSVTGMLTEPETFVTELGRPFDYAAYLTTKRVGYLLRYPHLTVDDHAPWYHPVVALLRLKHWMVVSLAGTLPMPEAGLAAGLLLGVTVSLGEALEQAFRDSGIIHIVVLSGYNMMLVVTFFMYVLAFVLPYRARLLVGLSGVWVFALVVGFSATVTRAAIMASILLLVRFGGFTHHALRALVLAGVVMVLINPAVLLYDIGFQLSFLATAALLLVAPWVTTLVSWWPTWLGREFLVATVATQLVVTPLLLYHMGAVSVVAVLVNILILPVVPLAMLGSAAVIGVSALLPVAAVVPAWPTYWLLWYIIALATTFAAVPGATVTVPAFGIGALVSAYGLGVGSICGYRYYHRTRRLRQARPYARWTIMEEI